MADLNRVTLTGNLTQDSELRGDDQNVLAVRLAVTGSRKVGDEWQDVPHFFDVTIFGNRGKALAQYLKKGSRLGVDGRLEMRQWEQDDGAKRQAVQVIAEDVVLLGDPKPKETASPS